MSQTTKRKKERIWTTEEEEFLKAYYPTTTVPKLAEMLNIDSVTSVRRKVDRMGLIKKERWSDSEIKTLENLYSVTKTSELVEIFEKKSVNSIRRKAQELGLTKDFLTNEKEDTWNKEKEDTLRKLYPTTTARELVKILNVSSVNSIQHKVRRLGLSKRQDVKEEGYVSLHTLARKLKVTPKKVREWVTYMNLQTVKKGQGYKKETVYIKLSYFWNWANNHKDLICFSNIQPKSLGVEPDWINAEREKEREKQNLNISETQKRWTEAEKEKLSELYGSFPIYTIEKRLNKRGIGNRVNKTKKYGRSVDNMGFLTAHMLAKHLNVDAKVVLNWVNKKGLPHKRTVTAYERKNILINPKQFWVWADENKKLLNFSKIERGVLLPEPEWLEQEIKKDYYNIPKRQRQPWTTEQERELCYLCYRKGLLYKEIGKILGRSENSIQRRISKLKKTNSPLLKQVIKPKF
ncbi:hypothetical protein P4679_25400 [Priestia megaterium]|uniref:hypothetical protein n=1 Tax=Priestia megaterium TaxID=1404 RepID=UPI002E1D1F56|nr:hypothetical protein [Priestia megaterium]